MDAADRKGMYYQLGEVKDIDKIQDDWFMDNVENHFEGRYPEEPRSTSMEQIMDCIDKAGVKWKSRCS